MAYYQQQLAHTGDPLTNALMAAFLGDAVELVASTARESLGELCRALATDDALREKATNELYQRPIDWREEDGSPVAVRDGDSPDIDEESSRRLVEINTRGADALLLNSWSITFSDGSTDRDSAEDMQETVTSLIKRIATSAEKVTQIDLHLYFYWRTYGPGAMSFPPSPYRFAIELQVTQWHLSWTTDGAKYAQTLRDALRDIGARYIVSPDAFLSQQPAEAFRVFLGHGSHPDWLILQNELQKHGFTVDEFDGNPRAGQTIQDVVSELLYGHQVGVFILAAEDKLENGSVRGRQNVVHEIGLFQGHHGWQSALVVARRDVEVPSNLQGIVRFDYEHSPVEVASSLSRSLKEHELRLSTSDPC